MPKVVPQDYTDLLCPNCGKPFVFIKAKVVQMQKPVPISQKQPYCRKCGYTAELSSFPKVPDTQDRAAAPCGQ